MMMARWPEMARRAEVWATDQKCFRGLLNVELTVADV